MEKNLIITIALVLLVVVSAAQSLQISSLKNTLTEGGASISGGSSVKSTSSAGGSSGSPQLPSSLQNLPGMVGGC